MLPARYRMRRAGDFAQTVRRGARGASSTVVVHLNLTDAARSVGFVVSKAVGNSVVRHRVVRRLREIAREMLPALPKGAHMVVRARPEAANSSFETLRRDVAAAAARAGLS